MADGQSLPVSYVPGGMMTMRKTLRSNFPEMERLNHSWHGQVGSRRFGKLERVIQRRLSGQADWGSKVWRNPGSSKTARMRDEVQEDLDQVASLGPVVLNCRDRSWVDVQLAMG